MDSIPINQTFIIFPFLTPETLIFFFYLLICLLFLLQLHTYALLLSCLLCLHFQFHNTFLFNPVLFVFRLYSTLFFNLILFLYLRRSCIVTRKVPSIATARTISFISYLIIPIFNSDCFIFFSPILLMFFLRLFFTSTLLFKKQVL